MKYIIIFILTILILLFLIKNKEEQFENNNWFNENIDLYFINLDISKNRRERMEKQLKKLNINFNRFSAYNGNKINKNFDNILTKNFKHVINYDSHIYNKKKGSLGNFISQMTCWYNFYSNSNKDFLMVMEDDIIINDNFNIEEIKKIILSLKKKDWTMIKLFHFGENQGSEENYLLNKGISKNHNERHNTGMQCYILNKKNIPNLIKDITPIKNKTFDIAVKKIMNNHNVFITKDKYVSTPEHNNSSDRKSIDKGV